MYTAGIFRLCRNEEKSEAMIMSVLLAAFGGGIGATIRYAVSRFLTKKQQPFFIATFVVNIIGSFFIGVAMRYILMEPTWYTLLAAGVLGGFTTFSTFVFDVFRLQQQKEITTMMLYLLLTLLTSIIAGTIGYAL